ncbi:hypothetical protein O6H91_13G103300 [Diphasiastrum complanatum]|nr:hypothetical protein O6H91_13G103300 [Diphasiastrum complanatum]
MASMVPDFMDGKDGYDTPLTRNSQETMNFRIDGHYPIDNSLLVARLQQHQDGFRSDDAAVCSASIERNSTHLFPQNVRHDQEALQVASPFNSLMNPSSSLITTATVLPMLASSSIMSTAQMMKSPAASAVNERLTGARDGLSPPVAAQLSQPYVSGFPQFKMVPGDTTPEAPNMQMERTSRQIHLLGKRCRNPAGSSVDESSLPSPGAEKLFHLTGVEQDVTAASQAISNQSHGGEVGGLQPQMQEFLRTAAGPVRTRVRARRGQATDPHSIAERLRRERIAERMKSLQELVPNSNKTDKASMLDEIIEYVKFLQLQVKVLSMSRLGGARAVNPSLVGLHSEGLNETGAAKSAGDICLSQNGAPLIEHQIAQLMEEDMGTAMQFLQTKGLCLMPIALANAISSKGNRHHSSNNGTDVAMTAAVAKRTIEGGVSDKAVNSLVELLKVQDSSAGEYVNAASDGAAIRSRKDLHDIKHEEEI